MDIYLTLDSGDSVSVTWDDVSEVFDVNVRRVPYHEGVCEWTLSLTGAQCLAFGQMIREAVERVPASGPIYWIVGATDEKGNNSRA